MMKKIKVKALTPHVSETGLHHAGSVYEEFADRAADKQRRGLVALVGAESAADATPEPDAAVTDSGENDDTAPMDTKVDKPLGKKGRG